MILGYARCSTMEQAAKGTTTMEVQARMVRGFAIMKTSDSFDFSMYSDPGVSGATPLNERPAGKQLLADVHRNDTVVASKLDRMFRSANDALATAELLKKKGVDLVLLDLGHEPVTSNGMAKCFFTMASAFAELERGRIAERMQDGRRAKREKGGCIGGVPYGWQKVGEGKLSMLVEDREEQDILALVLRMRRGKKSPSYIARKLTEMGVLSRVGNPWQAVQIDRMSRLAWRAEKAQQGRN